MKTVVYYIDPLIITTHPNEDPRYSVWFAITEDPLPPKPYDRVYLTRYTTRSFQLIDGKPEAEFKDDTEYKKRPKGFDYTNGDPDHRSSRDEEAYAAYLEWSNSKPRTITDPSNILEGIELGWMVETPMPGGEIKTDVDSKRGYYRYAREKPSPSSCYDPGRWPPTHFSTVREYCFLDYDTACVEAAKLLDDERKSRYTCLKIDAEESIEWAAERVPVEHKERVRFLLSSLEWKDGFFVRVYKGKVYFKNKLHDWQVVYTFEENKEENTDVQV